MDKRIAYLISFFLAGHIIFEAAAQNGINNLASYTKERIAASSEIQPLGSDVIGDVVDPVTYNVRFNHEDIYLAGNGPEIRIGRTFDVAERIPKDWRHLQSFADWELEIPRIETSILSEPGLARGFFHVALDPAKTWQVAGATPTQRTSERCSKFALPPMYSNNPNMNGLWWPGVKLKLPGQPAQSVLKRSLQNTLQPAPLNLPKVSNNFPLVTSENWQIACTTELKNAVNGEGFLVIDPQGTKYWFDWMTASNYHSYIDHWEPVGNPDMGIDVSIIAANAALMVTRVEDRFGNYVTYSYSGNNLTEVLASDGRHVRLAWRTHTLKVGSRGNTTGDYIETITIQPTSASPRVYRYEYRKRSDRLSAKYEIYAMTLSKVILPDGSTWEFNMDQFANSCAALNSDTPWDTPSEGCWSFVYYYQTLRLTGTIKAPSGVTGHFTFAPYKFSRNYDYPGREDDINQISVFYDDPYEVDYPHLVQKRLVGPGVDATWKYQDPQTGFLYGNIALGPGGTFRVEEPDGSVRTIEVNNLWRHRHEGRVLSESVYKDRTFSTLLKSVKYAYSDTNTGPYPTLLGDGISFFIIPRQSAMLWPQTSVQTTQDGRVFRSAVASDCVGGTYCFDIHARPTKLIKSSSPTP